MYSFFVDVSHEFFGNEMMLLQRLNELASRLRIFHPCENHLTIKSLCSNSSSPKLFLTGENSIVLSNTSLECT